MFLAHFVANSNVNIVSYFNRSLYLYNIFAKKKNVTWASIADIFPLGIFLPEDMI